MAETAGSMTSHSHFHNKCGYFYCEELSVVQLVQQLEAEQKLEKKSPIQDKSFSSDVDKKSSLLYDLSHLTGSALQSFDFSEHPEVPITPLFVYSKAQIIDNINAYKNALQHNNIKDYLVGYAMKANFNPTLCKLFFENGCGAVTVSGHEIAMAINLGVDPQNIVYNGNGKQKWEIYLAIKTGCMINVDSLFDLKHIIQASKHLKIKGKILLRVNPEIDAHVHPYLATGVCSSKFGIPQSLLPQVFEILNSGSDDSVDLIGLHCHLGSTIDKVQVFQECVELMLQIVKDVQSKGFSKVKYLNIGGGLGTDYKRRIQTTEPQHPHIKTANALKITEDSDDTCMPSPADLIGSVKDKILKSGLILILEPGRSLVANSAVLVTEVIGVKESESSNYIVVDGSMNEVIRPALYGAYHHIELAEPFASGETSKDIKCQVYDVVGPVCESGDFLGKNRLLQTPHEGCKLVIHDVGAYCSSMSSNYNLRSQAAEVLVDKDQWKVIKKRQLPIL